MAFNGRQQLAFHAFASGDLFSSHDNGLICLGQHLKVEWSISKCPNVAAVLLLQLIDNSAFDRCGDNVVVVDSPSTNDSHTVK